MKLVRVAALSVTGFMVTIIVHDSQLHFSNMNTIAFVLCEVVCLVEM